MTEPVTLASAATGNPLAAIAIALGLGDMFFGGDDTPDFTSGQQRIHDAQADTAEFMLDQMRNRAALTGPTVGPDGTLQGPMVDALASIQGFQADTENRPRVRFASRPFNPFGDPRDVQVHGGTTPERYVASPTAAPGTPADTTPPPGEDPVLQTPIDAQLNRHAHGSLNAQNMRWMQELLKPHFEQERQRMDWDPTLINFRPEFDAFDPSQINRMANFVPKLYDGTLQEGRPGTNLNITPGWLYDETAQGGRPLGTNLDITPPFEFYDETLQGTRPGTNLTLTPKDIDQTTRQEGAGIGGEGIRPDFSPVIDDGDDGTSTDYDKFDDTFGPGGMRFTTDPDPVDDGVAQEITMRQIMELLNEPDVLAAVSMGAPLPPGVIMTDGGLGFSGGGTPNFGAISSWLTSLLQSPLGHGGGVTGTNVGNPMHPGGTLGFNPNDPMNPYGIPDDDMFDVLGRRLTVHGSGPEKSGNGGEDEFAITGRDADPREVSGRGMDLEASYGQNKVRNIPAHILSAGVDWAKSKGFSDSSTEFREDPSGRGRHLLVNTLGQTVGHWAPNRTPPRWVKGK